MTIVAKKYVLAILLLLCSILLHCSSDRQDLRPSVVASDQCNEPGWNLKDTWIYTADGKTSWGFQVVAIDDHSCVFEDLGSRERVAVDKKSLQWIAHIDARGKRNSLRSNAGIIYDFPLYVGKKWDKMLTGGTSDGLPYNYLFSFKVVSLENVKVRAGTFRAFKIQMEQIMIGGNNDTAIHHVWYSPDVKNILKLKFVTSYGNWAITGIQDFELERFELAKGLDSI